MLVLTRSIHENIFIGTAVTDRSTFEKNITVCLMPATTNTKCILRLIHKDRWDVEQDLKCEHTGIRHISTFKDAPEIVYVLLLPEEELLIYGEISIKVFPVGEGKYKFGMSAPQSISFVRAELMTTNDCEKERIA